MLYNDKVLLALPYHTEFVQIVSTGVDITSTFCSLKYLQKPWTGLEGMSDGYTLNKSAWDSFGPRANVSCANCSNSYAALIYSLIAKWLLSFF